MYEKYPNIRELHCCIKEFWTIFKKRNAPLLYLFVEKYSKSKIKALKGFCERLKRNLDAVENAVAYHYSNGFVEGTNSRLKMIKRTMYGRCGKQLLEAKLRYMGNGKKG
ncbi:MAG: transposase [Clostridia bacterium]|nr:transposase [Clostridia bacterium]MDY5555173.1 transposase [Blautia sp.]